MDGRDKEGFGFEGGMNSQEFRELAADMAFTSYHERMAEFYQPDTAQKYIILHIRDAFRDAHGKPGRTAEPLQGYDTPMSYDEARTALRIIADQRPDEDFSIRAVADVLDFSKS